MKRLIFFLRTGSKRASNSEKKVSAKANAVFDHLKQKGCFKILKYPFICFSGMFSYLLVLLTFTSFISMGCERKLNLHTSSSSLPTFLKVEYGGCNNQTIDVNSQRTIEENQNDTIIFDFQNDTLIITVGSNYICCAKFNAVQNINDGIISLVMDDTTTFPEEYCRCECYYEFEYYFTNLSQMSYEVNAIIHSPDGSVYKLISQTFNMN
jgi:hypothetical protein